MAASAAACKLVICFHQASLCNNEHMLTTWLVSLAVKASGSQLNIQQTNNFTSNKQKTFLLDNPTRSYDNILRGALATAASPAAIRWESQQ